MIIVVPAVILAFEKYLDIIAQSNSNNTSTEEQVSLAVTFFDLRCFVGATLSIIIIHGVTKHISKYLLRILVTLFTHTYFAIKLFLTFGIDASFALAVILLVFNALLHAIIGENST